MSNKNPTVSVVIPVYNRGKFVGETVRSVLAQTYRDFEIVAVDDGSTDDSLAVLNSFAGDIQILRHPNGENRGQSAAINLALRRIRGRYVAILDSDDLWAPEKLAVLVEYLEAHPEIGLVYSNGQWVDEEGNSKGVIYGASHEESSDPAKVLMNCYFALPSNSVVRREAYEKAGPFDESYRTAQDHDMAVRLAEVTRLAYVDRVLWSYRRHTASVSKRSGEKRWRVGFQILEKATRRYPYSPEVIRKRRAVLHFRLGQLAKEQGAWPRFFWHMVIAGLLDPPRALGVLTRQEFVSSPHS